MNISLLLLIFIGLLFPIGVGVSAARNIIRTSNSARHSILVKRVENKFATQDLNSNIKARMESLGFAHWFSYERQSQKDGRVIDTFHVFSNSVDYTISSVSNSSPKETVFSTVFNNNGELITSEAKRRNHIKVEEAPIILQYINTGKSDRVLLQHHRDRAKKLIDEWGEPIETSKSHHLIQKRDSVQNLKTLHLSRLKHLRLHYIIFILVMGLLIPLILGILGNNLWGFLPIMIGFLLCLGIIIAISSYFIHHDRRLFEEKLAKFEGNSRSG